MESSKRRRFQVPITSYFSANPPHPPTQSATLSHYNYAAPTCSPNPVLPDKIQSSLLTVGMRVRKAVPEGYQTALKTSKLSAYLAQSTPAVATPATPSSYVELTPFCGGFKVGNLAVQTFPQPPTGDQDGTEFCPLDEESLPPSSQESIDSRISMPSNPHKRSYGSDSEAYYEDELVDTHASLLTPRWPSRTILRPKASRKTKQSATIAGAARFVPFQHNKLDDMWGLSGQENRDPASSTVESIDFEEAAFLRRREEVDEDFEMGGV